ncbi:hypothetical protein HS088_TW17G00988 [Tripterygium wilfordii]|uniref:PPM-type phosphatase domain-containing protein n=1 Tax=Tripterygium wilfordii TaxID=458696 RepID=A0A7J7CHD1_TRIWF|nr:hypothetical protein HS088_TW17G00988 [Tripterygium wilfordii]
MIGMGDSVEDSNGMGDSMESSTGIVSKVRAPKGPLEAYMVVNFRARGISRVENTLRQAFLLADLALADDCSVSSSSGTTALSAFVFGRLLMVANAGDCRAVLCHKGEAIDMSQDHRPIYPLERRPVEELGGYVDDGYLNGVLSVSRALGDWDMKFPQGSPSPLTTQPEFRQVVVTEDDEFLIIGCDGISYLHQ